MPRRFIDAPTEFRCSAAITLKDGSGAQCGRYAKVDGLCTQHARIKAMERSPTEQQEQAAKERRQQKGLRYEAEKQRRKQAYKDGFCKHGVYVGGIGIDWMCGECESE